MPNVSSSMLEVWEEIQRGESWTSSWLETRRVVTVTVQPTQYQTKTFFLIRRHAERAAAVYSVPL